MKLEALRKDENRPMKEILMFSDEADAKVPLFKLSPESPQNEIQDSRIFLEQGSR